MVSKVVRFESQGSGHKIELISYKSADADIVANESRKQHPMVRLNSGDPSSRGKWSMNHRLVTYKMIFQLI